MALGDPYATKDDLKAYLNWQQGASADAQMDSALASASSEINNHCERQFNQETAPSTRTFEPSGYSYVEVDDFWKTDDLVVNSAYWPTGGFPTSWTLGQDFRLERVRIEGQRIGPYGVIRANFRPFYLGFQSVQVTAWWGWESVPAPVKQACLILASQNFKLGDAPFGVAGFGEFGVVRVKDIPQVESKLEPYRRFGPIQVG